MWFNSFQNTLRLCLPTFQRHAAEAQLIFLDMGTWAKHCVWRSIPWNTMGSMYTVFPSSPHLHFGYVFVCCVCVFVCVCLCACCETLRTCTVVCMSFLCYVFLRCDVVFWGWANNELNISQTESIQQEVEILLLSLFSYSWSKLITKFYLNLGPGI